MKKNLILIFSLIGIFITSYSYIAYGIISEITNEVIELYNQTGDPIPIAERIIEDSGQTNVFSTNDVTDLKIYYGEFLPEQPGEEILTVLSFGRNYTLINIYAYNGEYFEYANNSELLLNSDANVIQIIGIPALEGDIFIIEGIVNALLGSFEQNTSLKGYTYIDGILTEVLNISQNIESYYKEEWFTTNPSTQGWTKISQEATSVYNPEGTPRITVNKNQTLSTAPEVENNRIPPDSSFTVKEEQTIQQVYFWNNKWKKFILKEMIENSTQSPVAVLEDLTTSPYALLGRKTQKYRIIRENGEIDIVDISSLSDVQ